MRLKYQLRGLGIGIIITAALLMGFSDDEKASAKTEDAVVMASTEEATEAVTTAEMVVETEETVPIILREENTESTESVASEEESTVDAETEMISVPEITTEEEMAEVETTQIQVEQAEVESMQETERSASAGNTDVVEIRIVKGDDSGTVARKLQVAGLVENASEYDAYLMQHGYDKKISVGTVEIAKGSTWLEIAEKISGKN